LSFIFFKFSIVDQNTFCRAKVTEQYGLYINSLRNKRKKVEIPFNIKQ